MPTGSESYLRPPAVHRAARPRRPEFRLAAQDDAYSPDDIEFMQQVARQVAVAVDNALNYEAARAYEEQLARERDRLRTLLEINNAVVELPGIKPLFQAISAPLRRTFGLDYASLLIHDPEIHALRLQMLDFPDGAGVIREDALVPLEDTLAGYVFRAAKAAIFSSKRPGDLADDRRHHVRERAEARSAACR